MSLKSKALIVQAKGRWEFTHDPEDAEMIECIEMAVAEIVVEKFDTIMDAIGA